MFRRDANTDLDPWELVGTEILNNAFQSVVAARRPTATDAQFSNGKGHIIGDDQHVFWWDLIKLYRLCHRITGKVHIGLRLHEDGFETGNGPASQQGSILDAVDANSEFLFTYIRGHESHVVAGVPVFHAWIAEKNDDPDIRTGIGFLSEKHRMDYSNRLEMEISS